MKTRYIIIITIILILALGFLFFGKMKKDDFGNISGEVVKDIPEDNEDVDIEPDDSQTQEISGDYYSDSSSEGSGGSDSGEIDSSNLPDIDSYSCGFYFDEYMVCGGTCPNGQCVQEGESCYCKRG